MKNYHFLLSVANINFGLVLVLLLIGCGCLGLAHAQTTVWSEDWEGTWTDNWHVDGGTWEVGLPTSGPGKAYAGQKCAATVLGGNYAEGVNSRLIRHTTFVVPALSQKPRLRFWHWYNFSNGDYGQVQIKIGDKDWQKLSEEAVWTWYCSGVWTCPSLDLSAYSGSTVQIAFIIYSEDAAYGDDTAAGWDIDNIKVETGEPVFNLKEGWE